MIFCKQCKKKIRYCGSFWEHVDGTLRHMAIPDYSNSDITDSLKYKLNEETIMTLFEELMNRKVEGNIKSNIQLLCELIEDRYGRKIELNYEETDLDVRRVDRDYPAIEDINELQGNSQ